MALTKAQLKEVLDKVYNNNHPYEDYSNDNFNGIRLYINDAEGNSDTTILTRKEDDNTYIVAIFPTKSWVYTEGTEEKVYKCRVINDDMVISEISNIYARGVGAYIKRLTYIKNICVFLGIKLSDNFNKENPVIYQDLSNICDKWFNTGKAPYFIGRYDRDNVPNYSTYVQYGVIKDICLYFNQLGVYRTSGSMDLCNPQFFNFFNENTTNLADFPTFEEFYKTVDKDKYYKRLKEIILFRIKDYSNIADKDECANSIVNILKIQYGDEINIDDILETYINITDSSTYPFTLRLINTEKTCKAGFDGSTGGAFELWCLYNDNNFSQTTFEIIKQSDGTITHNKSTTLKNANTFYYTQNNLILNLKCDKLLKLYNGDNFNINTYISAYPVEYYDRLSINTTYNIGSQIKLLDERFLLCTDLRPNSSFYYYMKHNNIILGENDIFIILRASINGSYKRIACIIKDVNTFRVSNNNSNLFSTLISSTQLLSQIVYKTRSNNVDTIFPILSNSYNGYYNGSSTNNDIITLDSNKECYIYNMTDLELLGDMTLNNTFQYSDICSYIGATLDEFSSFINFGEFIDYVPPTSLEGLSVIEGSTLPSTVIDEPTFNTFLNSINAKRNPIRNPYYVKDELQDSTNLELWVQCTIYDTPPTTQAEAVDNDIDDMPEAEVENLEDDIESSTEGDDEDDDGIEPNEETLNDEGTNDNELDAEDMANALAFSFLKQYNMSEAQLQDFASIIFNQSGSFFGQIKNLFTNPIEGILSLQIAPELLVPLDSKVEGMKINGVDVTDGVIAQLAVPRLNTNIHKFDIGTLHVPKVFDTYQDITESKLKIYLPFVGYIDLDLALFLDKDIKLSCVVDSLSGSIVYYIYSVDGNEQRLIEQPSGLCYEQIPLNGDATQTFLLGLITGGKNG